MALLAELSTDVLLVVLSYLPPADKATISRVCKWLQRFVEPVLYADVRLESRSPPTDAFHLHPHLLLLKFLAAPDLGPRVKRFQTSTWRDDRALCRRKYDWFSDSQFEIVSNLAKNAATPGDESLWKNNAGDANHGIHQTLLIFQLPNLTELSVGYDIRSNFESVGKMLLYSLCFERAIDGLSKFQHLKRVDLCVNMNQRDCCTPLYEEKHRSPHLWSFFYLPSIEHLRMVMPYHIESFRWPVTQPCTKSLTSLSLKRSSASETLLARILAVTPNLKCLEYGFLCEERNYQGPTSLCAEGLGEALAHVKATLEQLTISVHCEWWYDNQSEDVLIRYGIKGCLSLHDFENLVMLEVPMALLLGHKPTPQTSLTGRIPPRIRQLCLKHGLTRYAKKWKCEVILGLLRDHLIHDRAQPVVFETLSLKFDRDDKSTIFKISVRQIIGLSILFDIQRIEGIEGGGRRIISFTMLA